jgi:hypothetical protein
MSEELNKQLATLAEKLHISVDHLWSVLVRQAYIDGLSSLTTTLVSCVLAVVAIYGFRLLRRNYEAAEKKEFLIYPRPPLDLVFLGLVLFALLVIASNNFYRAISDFFNPEFYAFRQLSGVTR